MAITPIQNVWFDDAATLAMGEAFDRACKSSMRKAFNTCPYRRAGSRSPFLAMSMLVVSVGRDLPVPAYASVTQAA